MHHKIIIYNTKISILIFSYKQKSPSALGLYRNKPIMSQIITVFFFSLQICAIIISFFFVKVTADHKINICVTDFIKRKRPKLW